MEQRKFDAIAKNGTDMLRTALMRPFVPALAKAMPGEVIAYNGYLRGMEVVVLGNQWVDEDGATLTKPLAVLISPDLFLELRVDQEAGRLDENGDDQPPHVI